MHQQLDAVREWTGTHRVKCSPGSVAVPAVVTLLRNHAAKARQTGAGYRLRG